MKLERPRQERHEAEYPGVVYYETTYRGVVQKVITDWEEAEGDWDCRHDFDSCPNSVSYLRGCENCEEWRSSQVEGEQEAILEKIPFIEYTLYIRLHGKEQRLGGTAWEGMTPKKANQIQLLRRGAAGGPISHEEARAKELHILTKDFPGKSINALWLRHRTKQSMTADFKKEHMIFRRDIMPFISPAIWSPLFEQQRSLSA